MWLKPGQRYLFGRVKKDGVMIAIDHKTVSRQHFNIIVDPVEEGDVGNVFTRTKIRVEDHSKTGTFVNGEPLKKKDPKDGSESNPSKELKDAENSIRPGTCPHEFTVTWQPCVFTFNLLKKEIKSGVLKQKQSRVQNLDIKAISDFSSDQTTHVIANKRNTAKGLLALVNGKFLVTEAYLDALDYASSPLTLSQDVNMSPLENDFDTAWPNPKDFLPPPGKEPTIKPPEVYQPDLARTNVFEHYTFVFGDQTQYDNLMPVITSGHGKALLFKVVNSETTSDELIQFLQNAAGHKSGGLQNGSSQGGAILVRWSPKYEDLQEWTNSLINEAVLKMDQRAIDQSEFLEAILSNDAGLLKQPVPFESATDGVVPPPPSAANSLVPQQAVKPRTKDDTRTRRIEAGNPPPANPSATANEANLASRPLQPSATNSSRIDDGPDQSAPKPFSPPKPTQTTKFENFDDRFDPDAIEAYDEDEIPEEDDDVSEPPNEPRSSTQVSKIKREPPSTSKKRARSLDDESQDSFAHAMDDLLPAATALKRRKLAQAAIDGNLNQLEEIQQRTVPVKKVKKEKILNVLEVVKRQREKEEAARHEAEAMEHDMLDLDDRAPTYLAEVVTVELPLRDKTNKENNRADRQLGAEWDPKWNGRKNFKAFRRKGDAPQRRSHARKVIVPLEEVPNKTGGLGDQYYSKTQEEIERKRRQQVRSQHLAQSQAQKTSKSSSSRSNARIISDDEEEEIALDFDDGDDDHASVARTSPGVSRLQREAEAIAEHEIDPDTPRRTRASDQTQRASLDGSDTEHGEPTQTRTQAQNGKRAAPSNVDASKAKRQKTLPVVSARDADSDDDDDTKFRFGSRSRRGRGRGRGGKA